MTTLTVTTLTVKADGRKNWGVYVDNVKVMQGLPNWTTARDRAVQDALSMTPTARVEVCRLSDGAVKQSFVPRPSKVEMDELVQAVKDHALANYEADGWDFIVECYTDEELAELIGKVRSVKSAIAKCRSVVKTQADHRSEIQATAY